MGEILSPYGIQFLKPTYKAIPDGRVKTGDKRERMTLNLRVTLPIMGTRARIGSVTSTATLHIAFVHVVN